MKKIIKNYNKLFLLILFVIIVVFSTIYFVNKNVHGDINSLLKHKRVDKTYTKKIDTESRIDKAKRIKEENKKIKEFSKELDKPIPLDKVDRIDPPKWF